MKKTLTMAVVIFLTAVSLYSCGGEGGSDKDITAEPDFSSEKVYSVDSTKGVFYHPDDMFNNYSTTEYEFDGTAQSVIDKLFELGNYGTNKVKVNSWYIRGNTMFVDFSKELKSATGSSAQEYFSVFGTVKTLKSCFCVDYVCITVDGESLKTPHGQYDEPLS